MGKNKNDFKDDGRVIANMNVEGMPWNLSGPLKPSVQRIQPEQNPLEKLELSRAEKRALIGGALSVILPIALVFGLAYLGIFLFIDLIWLA